MNLTEMSITEMRAAIMWRLKQIPIPTTASMMSETFSKYAEEITEMEAEIKRRKAQRKGANG